MKEQADRLWLVCFFADGEGTPQSCKSDRFLCAIRAPLRRLRRLAPFGRSCGGFAALRPSGALAAASP
ncbi:MAG: hypothetical protein ACI4J7_00600, partial [Ruminiclostridium sp.]